MTYHLCHWKQLVKSLEEFVQSIILGIRQGVGRFAIHVKSTLVTDANGATIVGSCVRTHFQQSAMLRHRTIPADVEMVANGAKTTCLVVFHHLLYRITLAAAGGRAVEH